MRTLLRAAAYRAAGWADGRAVPARDEDAFTILATALERALDGHDRAELPLEVDLVGEVPTSVEAELPAITGSSVRVLRSAGTARGLSDALARAHEGQEGPSLVVAVEVPPVSAETEAHDAAGVAFLFGESEAVGRANPLAVDPDEESAVRAAVSLARAERTGGSETAWVGDWEARERPLRRPVGAVATATAAEPRTDLVSQGAYVPRARYRENLPSRWRFLADRCPDCRTVTFPARGRCRRCGRTEGLIRLALPRDDALVVATTVIGSGGQPTEFDPQVEALGPYEVVLAEIAPGARVTLQLTDAVPGEVRIGDRVDTLLRRLYPLEGEWRYGRKAVPRPA